MASDDEDDADEDSDGSDVSDGSCTAPVKTHSVLAAKRKVCLCVFLVHSSIIDYRQVLEQRGVLMHRIIESMDISCFFAATL